MVGEFGVKSKQAGGLINSPSFPGGLISWMDYLQLWLAVDYVWHGSSTLFCFFVTAKC